MTKLKRPERRWRYRLTALLVSVGVLAQIAWFMAAADLENYESVTGPVIVGCVGLALLLCAALLYLPEAIERARQAYRERQDLKDRFR